MIELFELLFYIIINGLIVMVLLILIVYIKIDYIVIIERDKNEIFIIC